MSAESSSPSRQLEQLIKSRETIDSERSNGNIHPEFNTNLKDYTLDDIFSLLDVEVHNTESYDEMKDEINTKIDVYVRLFEGLKNEIMVEFFESIRMSLFGKLETDTTNLTEAEKLLLVYDDKFNAETNRGFVTKGTDTTNNSMYDNTKGAGNPINRKTITKLITIDSKFRRNYNSSTSTDYNVELPYLISNVIELKLSDMEFPTTSYPFNDDFENNYFWLKYCYDVGELKVEKFIYFYIEPGNYYHTVMINNINSVFTSNGIPLVASFDLDYNNAGGVGVGNGKVSIGIDVDSSYNLVVIDEVELNFNGMKLTPDIPGYHSSHLESDNDVVNKFYYGTSTIPIMQRMGWILGFRYPFYSGSTYYTTEGILDMLGSKYLYLVVDDLNSSSNVNFFSNSETTLLNGNILARISQKGYAFSIQSQGDFSIYAEPRYYYGPVNIHKLNIKVIDEFNRIVNLNGMDFSFTMVVTTIYSQT